MNKWPFSLSAHGAMGEDYLYCLKCNEKCYNPEGEEGYDFLCVCCKEPLYELRIAELESELAMRKLAVFSKLSEGCDEDTPGR